MKVYSGEDIWDAIEFVDVDEKGDPNELCAELYVKKSDIEALLKTCGAESLLDGVSEDEH